MPLPVVAQIGVQDEKVIEVMRRQGEKAIGYWLLVIGYWLLVIGDWLLVMGDW